MAHIRLIRRAGNPKGIEPFATAVRSKVAGTYLLRYSVLVLRLAGGSRWVPSVNAGVREQGEAQERQDAQAQELPGALPPLLYAVTLSFCHGWKGEPKRSSKGHGLLKLPKRCILCIPEFGNVWQRQYQTSFGRREL